MHKHTDLLDKAISRNQDSVKLWLAHAWFKNFSFVILITENFIMRDYIRFAQIRSQIFHFIITNYVCICSQTAQTHTYVPTFTKHAGAHDKQAYVYYIDHCYDTFTSSRKILHATQGYYTNSKTTQMIL